MSQADTRSHRLAWNLRWLGAAYVVQKTATLLSLAFLARYFGDADFGKFAVALAIPTALEAVTDLGLGWAVVREGAGRPELARALAITALPAKLALGAVTVGLTFAIARSLALPEDTVVAASLLAVAKAFDSLTYLARAVFQTYERMEFDAAAQSLDAIVRLLLTVYALLGGFGVTGLAKALVVAAAIVFTGSAAVGIHRFVRPMRPRWDLLPGLVAAGLPLAAIWLLESVALRLGIVLTGEQLGPGAAGNLAAAVRLIEPLLAVGALLATALLPLATRHIVEARSTVPWLFRSSVKMAVLGALAAALILFGSGPEIVQVVFGNGFVEARELIRALAPAIVPLFVHALFVPLLIALRRHVVAIASQVAGVAVNAGLVLALSDVWGPAAAAAGLFAGEIVVLIVVIAAVPEVREFGVIGALASVGLAGPAALAFVLSGTLGDVAATALALSVLFIGVRLVGVVEEREIVYLEGIGRGVGWVSRVLLSPLR